MTRRQQIYRWTAAALIALIVGTVAFYLLAPVGNTKGTAYLLVDDNDDLDSVAAKLALVSHEYGVTAFRTLARHTGYVEHIRTGRYAITPTTNAILLLRHLSHGQQEPLRLTIPPVRTADDLATELSSRLMMTKQQLLARFNSNDSLAPLGCDTATVVCLFVPNTYELYWDITPARLLAKMKREHAAFWNADRQAKAQALGLTPYQVQTLASIVDEETANRQEKPDVAGMYYNRLRADMPLQADPTVKFALRDFTIRRIRQGMLRVQSPYNTYTNHGLPPGPIRIATVEGIDAVLNLTHHSYLYMCAREDFSGTHRFATTYTEHLRNAAAYAKALNDKGIE